MQSSISFTPSKEFALLLVGPPLSGKTNVAMSFPTPYFFSTDRKLGNAVGRHPNKVFYYDYPAVEPAKQWTAMCDALKAAAVDPKIETIVIDNLTDAARFLCDHIIANGGTKLTVGGEKVMEKQHWQPFQLLMVRLIVTLKSSGKIFVVCAHEAQDKDEVTGMISYTPNISGALRTTLGAYFTDVWHCETELIGKECKYIVRSMPTPRMALGNSLGLPQTFSFTWEEFNKQLKYTLIQTK